MRQFLTAIQGAAGLEEFVRGVWRHYPLAICSGALREEIRDHAGGREPAGLFFVIVSRD